MVVASNRHNQVGESHPFWLLHALVGPQWSPTGTWNLLLHRSGTALRGQHRAVLVRQRTALSSRSRSSNKCVAHLVALHFKNQRAVEQRDEADRARRKRRGAAAYPGVEQTLGAKGTAPSITV